AERGPVSPQLITSYAGYQRLFGGVFAAKKFLPHAVNGFFENGGKRAFVSRVVGNYDDALAALEAPARAEAHALRAISVVYALNATADVAKAVVAHCEKM